MTPGNLGAWESSGIVDASSVFGPGAFPDGARAFLARQRAITLGLLGAVFTCMVLMRFGI